MAQHFVTVCVVCVLCAAHNPCSAHTDLSSQKPDSYDSKYFTIQNYKQIEQNKDAVRNSGNDLHSSLRKSRTKDTETLKEASIHRNDVSSLDNLEIMERLGQIAQKPAIESFRKDKSASRKSRSKRHSEVDEKYFTKKVFETYGNGENMTMEGFEKLLRNLGLRKLVMELDKDISNTESSIGEENLSLFFVFQIYICFILHFSFF